MLIPLNLTQIVSSRGLATDGAPLKMTCWTSNLVVMLHLAGTLLLCTACGDDADRNNQQWAVRVGQQVLTVAEFNQAFEMAKSAYSRQTMQLPGAVRAVRLQILDQLTEEMLVLERARELGIEISAAEAEKAIAAAKASYPDDVFRQTLIESAVPYAYWEKNLKKRLLIEKVVAVELGEKIVIRPEEVEKYYQDHFAKEEDNSQTKADVTEMERQIIANLRRDKLEAAYSSWIKLLKAKYAIEINKRRLEKVISP